MKGLSTSLLLLVCLFGYINGYSQHLCEAQATSTTGWDWRGSTDYTFYLYGSRYLNSGGVVKKKSPWYDTNTNENVSAFRYENPKNYEPNQGWILIQRDFGAPGRFINHPYFILYNRYAGILRVFVAITETVAGYNKAAISLGYAKGRKRTAILGFHDGTGHIQSTRHFNNNVAPVKVGNTYAYDLPYWLHADFVMNYDPCSCKVPEAALEFSVDLISESTLKFTADGKATPQDVLGRTASGKLAFADITGKAKSTADMFKSATSGIKTILETKYEANDPEKVKPWTLLGYVPGLGGVISAVDAFVGLFSDKKVTNMPVAYKLDFKASGTITTTDTQRPIFMDVPSASVNLIPNTLVQWRNTLGVFALLEAPTFTVTDGMGSVNVCPPEYSGFSGCTYKNKNITLNRDLKFAVNSAAYPSTSNYTISVALEVDAGVGQRTPYVAYDCSSSSPPVTLTEVRFDRIGSVYLRVVVTFDKTMGSTLNEAVFSARYPARAGTPSGSCTRSTQYASGVSAVCNSTDYKNRTTQYLRTEVAGYEKVLPIEENIDNSSFSVFPNPSNGLVSFEYGLVTFGYVSVNVMDMSGREVIKVVNNQFYTPGEHRVQIDLQEERKIAPGVYLCRMKTDQGEKIQRLIIQ